MIDQERQQKLRELWRRERIPTRSVWVNFHSQMLVQKFFCMNIPQDELLAALTLEAEESFPSHENEVVLDYHLNEERGPNGELCGMLYALPAWELQAQIAMLKQAGLMVCGVSSGACDLSNLFSLLAPEKTDHFAQCLVNLSTHFADIVIMYGARSIYSRTVLSRSGPWVKNLDYLAENLNDALLYYSQWVSEKQVETILISGTISEEVDICGALLERTGMPVYAWNPFEENSGVRLTAAAKSLDCSPLDLVNSVALAMRRG
jgi:Tfp pilus assembly PilM family ATPase